MAGRPKNKGFEELGFELIKTDKKYAAACTICKKKLLNTSESRLRGHRNVCNLEHTKPERKLQKVKEDSKHIILYNEVNHQNESREDEDVTLDPLNAMEVDFSIDDKVPKEVVCLPGPSSSKSTSLSMSKNNKRPRNKIIKSCSSSAEAFFVNEDEDDEEETFADSVAILIFGCNLPLRLVDSVLFKNFIKKLKPNFASKIPDKNTLLTSLLDNHYKKCISATQTLMCSDAILLIDSWVDKVTNNKSFISMLQNANGEHTLLDIWELPIDDTTKCENLCEIIVKSINKAEEMYSIKVYAIVCDNANTVIEKLEKCAQHLIWYSNCNRHIVNLFADDILDKKLTDKVIFILNKFKQNGLEKLILKKGGSSIKLPCDTSLCSYKESYQCLIQNSSYMKSVISELNKNLKEKLILDDEFLEEVKENIKLFEPICDLINNFQSSKCSVADAVNLWIDVKLPFKYVNKYNTILKSRIDMVLNQYALAAFYLHPHYDTTKLNDDCKNIIANFLFDQLDGTGIEEWDNFRTRTSFFKKLYEKDIKNPLVFWKTAALRYPTISNLALKLLHIPASSLQMEKLYVNWSRVQSPTQNILTTEQSKKIFHLYHSHRIKENDDLSC